MSQRGLKGTWPQAISAFLLPILIILGIRWALVEPFVIPSSSMVPNLLIHDHILVLKSSLGLRWPFTDQWLTQWRAPQRGDVMVFRYPENPNVFYVKRLIGLPGDHLSIIGGKLTVNGNSWNLEKVKSPDDEADFDYFMEDNGQKSYLVRFLANSGEWESGEEIDVPEDQFFFMGDNRDQSSDSRVWGFVPRKNLVGPAWLIWLSCDQTLVSASYICDFFTLRPQRMLKFIP